MIREYFSHDYNARNDSKMVDLQMKYGLEGIGIYWCIVEMMYENEGKINKSECERIAYELRTDTEKIKNVLETDLFEKNGDKYYSKSIQKRLQKRDEKSQKARKSALSKWGKNSEDIDYKYSSTRSKRLSEARKMGTHTKEQWHEMREFFGKCVKCEAKSGIVKDHIMPIYQGGSDGLDNLQPLCRTCNAAKGPENIDYREAYCLRNDCKMPAKYKKMPTIKEKKRKVKEKDINIYRQFDKLKMTVDEFEKLKAEGYTKKEIDDILDAIENFRDNKKYKNLLLTARNWLKDNKKKQPEKKKFDEYSKDFNKRW